MWWVLDWEESGVACRTNGQERLWEPAVGAWSGTEATFSSAQRLQAGMPEGLAGRMWGIRLWAWVT